MNKTLTEIAQKMAEEKYPLPQRRDFMADRQAVYFNRTAYLAGFEARDGMDARLMEEHAEMLDELRWIRNNAGEDRIMNICESLITKIESK